MMPQFDIFGFGIFYLEIQQKYLQYNKEDYYIIEF